MLSTAAAKTLRLANERIAAQVRELDDPKTSIIAKMAAFSNQLDALKELAILLEEQSCLVEEKERFLLAQTSCLEQRAARVREQEGRIQQQTQLYATYMATAQLQIRNYQAREQVVEQALDDFTQFEVWARGDEALDAGELGRRLRVVLDRFQRAWQQQQQQAREYSEREELITIIR